MNNFENQPINEDEAKIHLFTKLKYHVAINGWSKLIQVMNQQCKDRVVFHFGTGQCSFPKALVRSFTNIKSDGVRLSDKYSQQEVKTLFEILMNLPRYSCQGLIQDYSDWTPITSLVNMIELSQKFGMLEIHEFLTQLPKLFSEHNRNCYEIEIKRREVHTVVEPHPSPSHLDVREDEIAQPERRTRSRSRSMGFKQAIARSLSRGRKPKNKKMK